MSILKSQSSLWIQTTSIASTMPEVTRKVTREVTREVTRGYKLLTHIFALQFFFYIKSVNILKTYVTVYENAYTVDEVVRNVWVITEYI